jgi:hypothetical protein
MDAGKNESLLMRFDAPGSTLALMLEDDGKVAYAYLLDGEEIVGDVWLYNVAESPEEIELVQSAMPFLNPRKFCREDKVTRLTEESVIDCNWSNHGVTLSVDGVLMARLEMGAKPGWSKLAACPGPLANPLNIAL